MSDIVGQLNERMKEPDIVSLLFQSVEEAFRNRFPDAMNITLTSTENPDAIHVRIEHLPLTYTMKMTEEWENQEHFRFTFTNQANPLDTITVDVSEE